LGRFLVEFRVLRGSEEIAGIKSAKFLISGLLTPNTMPQKLKLTLKQKVDLEGGLGDRWA
jgi:hypothetical protein